MNRFDKMSTKALIWLWIEQENQRQRTTRSTTLLY